MANLQVVEKMGKMIRVKTTMGLVELQKILMIKEKVEVHLLPNLMHHHLRHLQSPLRHLKETRTTTKDPLQTITIIKTERKSTVIQKKVRKIKQRVLPTPMMVHQEAKLVVVVRKQG